MQQYLSMLEPSKSLIYLISVVLGVYVSFQLARTNGRTLMMGFWDYLWKETPGATTATVLTLATIAGFVLGSNVLDAVPNWVIVNLGFWKGLGLDTAIAPKMPSQLTAAEVLPVDAPKQAGFVRLGALLVLVAAALVMAACGLFGDAKPVITGAPASCKVTDPQTKAVTVNALCADAFDAINQANVLLISVDKAVTDRVNNRIWTVDQALPYYRKTTDAGTRLDQAQLLFTSGTYTSAKAQADATKTLLLLLQKEIAAQAALKSESPITDERSVT